MVLGGMKQRKYLAFWRPMNRFVDSKQTSSFKSSQGAHRLGIWCHIYFLLVLNYLDGSSEGLRAKVCRCITLTSAAIDKKEKYGARWSQDNVSGANKHVEIIYQLCMQSIMRLDKVYACQRRPKRRSWGYISGARNLGDFLRLAQ